LIIRKVGLRPQVRKRDEIPDVLAARDECSREEFAGEWIVKFCRCGGCFPQNIQA
jgi:hypothetical protein